MKKLTISQIMNLADKLNKTEWITILIDLNNNGQIDKFFQTIKQTDILNSVIQNTAPTR